MKSFIIKIIIFALIPVVITIVTYTIKSNNIETKLQEIAANNEVVILGDSHMGRIQPAHINLKSVNIASPGEHYFYSFSKLKRILENKNSKIRVVLLGVSPHNFAPIYKKKIDLNDSYGKASLMENLYFFNIYDNEAFSFNEIIRNSHFYKGIYSKPEWGGWFHSKHSNPSLEIILKSVTSHYCDNNQDSYSSQSLYLSKIVELCSQHKITLCLVSLPVHEEYKIRIPKKYLELDSMAIKSHSSEVTYMNFLHTPLASNYLADGDHINDYGSEIITFKIDSIINTINFKPNSLTKH